MKALIVGGGVGGLAAGIALRQAGIEPVVFERQPRLTEIGAGLTLWPNAIRALRHLGVEDAVAAAAARVERAETLTWRGKLIRAMDLRGLEARFGAPCLCVHRAELQRTLAEALPPGAVRVDAAVGAIDQDGGVVEIRLDDGRVERGDLVVGADGIHSAVRRELLGDGPPRYAGYTAWRGVAPGAGFLTPGTTAVYLGPGCQVGLVPLGRRRTYWFATANVPSGGDTPTSHKADVLTRLAGWCAPVRAVVEATPVAAILRHDIHDRDPVSRWGTGRATLLGDAAHPTTPNLGQGACQALEDAVVLARHLVSSADPVAGLRAYELERQPRTRLIVRRSRELGRLFQTESAIVGGLRDMFLRFAPRLVMARQMEPVLRAAF